MDWQSHEALMACALVVLNEAAEFALARSALDRYVAFLAATGQEDHPLLPAMRSEKTAELSAQLRAVAQNTRERIIPATNADVAQRPATERSTAADVCEQFANAAKGGPPPSIPAGVDVCCKRTVFLQTLRNDAIVRSTGPFTVQIYPSGFVYYGDPFVVLRSADYDDLQRAAYGDRQLDTYNRRLNPDKPPISAADVVDAALIMDLVKLANEARKQQVSFFSERGAEAVRAKLIALGLPAAATLVAAIAQFSRQSEGAGQATQAVTKRPAGRSRL